MGAPYTQTHGFRQDRERFFDMLERLTAAIERLATALEKNDANTNTNGD